MTQIRYAVEADREYWFTLDKHLPPSEFENKTKTKRAYVLSVSGQPRGIFRYNLFWDNVPFCTLFISKKNIAAGDTVAPSWNFGRGK